MGVSGANARLAVGACALACLVAAPAASAQESGARFGQRGAFVVSFERVFGFQNQKFREDGQSIDSTGLQPMLWGNFGLFGVSASGVSFGALLGFTRMEHEAETGNIEINLAQLRPRIGKQREVALSLGAFLDL